MFGIQSRSTRDMDVTIKGIDVSKEKMVQVLNEILSIDLEDGVKFEVVDITDIREDDEYGGNKYHLIGKIENLKVALEIDISTGDEVTPKELDYQYQSLFENKKINISTYNIETILAEKIETILTRGKYNTRMKDYYDVHMFLTNFSDKYNIENLKLAMKNTFNKRKSFESLRDYVQILESIASDDRAQKLWNTYARKNTYAKGIEFISIADEIENMISSLDIDIVSV